MKARAAHALRWAACLCALGVVALAGPQARAQSAADSAPAGAYQDRLINGGSLAPDISTGDYLSTSDPSGLARSIRIDAVASVLSQQGPNAAPTLHENGIVADAQWETSTYGACRPMRRVASAVAISSSPAQAVTMPPFHCTSAACPSMGAGRPTTLWAT